MRKTITVILLTVVFSLCFVDCTTHVNAPDDVSQPFLTIINNTSFEIFYLYVSPSNSSNWGTDQLGSSTIPAGTSCTVRGLSIGQYDVKAITKGTFCRRSQILGISVPGAGSSLTLNGSDFTSTVGSFSVVNHSSYSFYYLYMRSTGNSAWGADLLGSATLEPGDSLQFNGIPVGSYDLRAETQNHAQYTQTLNTVLNECSSLIWIINNFIYKSVSTISLQRQ